MPEPKKPVSNEQPTSVYVRTKYGLESWSSISEPYWRLLAGSASPEEADRVFCLLRKVFRLSESQEQPLREDDTVDVELPDW